MTTIAPNSLELTTPQFAAISRMVRRLAGINLRAGKQELVRARLGRRLRALGLATFGQYLDRLADADTGEVPLMLDALCTNVTHFFREPRHFAVFGETTVPEMLARRRNGRRLRIWSAGCSSGEEPYSLGIILREAIPDLAAWNAAILATDLSWRALRAAREGSYAPAQLREVSPERLRENFVSAREGTGNRYRVADAVRALVHFARLNLMEPWPMQGPFDAVFCRNVMIYFDKPTQQRLVERFWDILAPGGVLFIGHAESLTGIRQGFRYVEPAVYQKT